MFFSERDGSGEKIFSGDKTFLHFHHGDHQLLLSSSGGSGCEPKVQPVSYYESRVASLPSLMRSDQGLIGH